MRCPTAINELQSSQPCRPPPPPLLAYKRRPKLLSTPSPSSPSRAALPALCLSQFLPLLHEQSLRHRRRSPHSGHFGPIPSTVSISTHSSTSPKLRPSLSLPVQSPPRVRRPPPMAARGFPRFPQQPSLGSPKIEPPLPPLSNYALSFRNGGRNHHFIGAQASSCLWPWRARPEEHEGLQC